ncbi:MAG: hypothetical protein IT585_04575 [candidate division Zixibacteria bacterium]|nr:hypothetical protein [candidate division Zixibacteria bacterium]
MSELTKLLDWSHNVYAVGRKICSASRGDIISGTFTKDFIVADHQGNVRNVFNYDAQQFVGPNPRGSDSPYLTISGSCFLGLVTQNLEYEVWGVFVYRAARPRSSRSPVSSGATIWAST